MNLLRQIHDIGSSRTGHLWTGCKVPEYKNERICRHKSHKEQTCILQSILGRGGDS